MAQNHLMRSLCEQAVTQLQPLLREFCEDTAHSLLGQADTAKSNQEQAALFSASEVFRQHRDTIESQYIDALQQAFGELNSGTDKHSSDGQKSNK